VCGRNCTLYLAGHHCAQRLVQAQYAWLLPLALSVAQQYERWRRQASLQRTGLPGRSAWGYPHLLSAVGARHCRQGLARVVRSRPRLDE
jgi:hypothetical protein